MRLYLVRHAQSMDNLQGRVSGQSDPPLSPAGLKQAEAVARRLSGLRPGAVYSSDLGRAVDTIRPAAHLLGLEVQTSALLREAHMGAAQGLTRAEMEALFPEDLRRWREDPIKCRPPGGERIEDLIQRCAEFLARLKAQWPDDAVVAAAVHLGSLRGLICAALDLSADFYSKFHSANAALSALDLGERTSLSMLGDVCHLCDLQDC